MIRSHLKISLKSEAPEKETIDLCQFFKVCEFIADNICFGWEGAHHSNVIIVVFKTFLFYLKFMVN